MFLMISPMKKAVISPVFSDVFYPPVRRGNSTGGLWRSSTGRGATSDLEDLGMRRGFAVGFLDGNLVGGSLSWEFHISDFNVL